MIVMIEVSSSDLCLVILFSLTSLLWGSAAIRTAAKWYDSHLAVNFGRDSALGIALITDDADNRRKAIEDGLAAFSGAFWC